MSDDHPADGNAAAHPEPAKHAPFPFVRLFYALGFAIIAWFVVHLVFALAIIQFVVIAITGKSNDELKAFSANLVQYLCELLAFVVFVNDASPFPLGPFPKRV